MDMQALTTQVGGLHVTSLQRQPSGEGQRLMLGYLNDAAIVALACQSSKGTSQFFLALLATVMGLEPNRWT